MIYLLLGWVIFTQIEPIQDQTKWDAAYPSIVQQQRYVWRAKGYAFDANFEAG